MFRLLPCFRTPADNAGPDFSSSKSFIRDAWKNETGLFPFFPSPVKVSETAPPGSASGNRTDGQ